MKFPRLRMMATAVVAGTLLSAPLSATGHASTVTGLPLYEFVNSGSGPLPWNAVSFESSINNSSMLAGVHAVSGDGASALTYRTTSGDIALYAQNASASANWTDISSMVSLPTPENDPVPFLDPSGAIDLLYVSTTGHLVLVSPTYTRGPRTSHLSAGTVSPAPAPYQVTDLTALSGVTVASGLPSIEVNGQSALLAVRSTTNALEAMTLNWVSNRSVPQLAAPAVNVSSATALGTIASDPVALASSVAAIAAITSTGSLELFTSGSPTTTSWTPSNLTSITASPLVAGSLATTVTATSIYVAALTTVGNVELYATSAATLGSSLLAHTSITTPTLWTATNVTGAATGAPPLSGSLFMAATPTQLVIAGQARSWGDLFVLTNTVATTTWSATDVSATGGTAARTVGSVVTGIIVNSTLDLFAAGINSPPLQGVGVYAIPSSKWTQAVTDGWPVLADTGGLGTQSAPWVGFTSASSVATSPDFLMGQSIYNAHKRVTWFSFWTVSGPLAGQALTTTNYYNHGFAAGAWVATQIDSYRALGVGLKPDWVIFDPEGYPDNHSGLDAPGGASSATVSTYATYWSAMLKGWVQGLASVDPSLNAGVYASQSEYRNYNLASQTLPVFEALSFGDGGPIPIAGAKGSNIRGYVAYGASCTPATTLASEMSTLLNAPWGGQFNTLQFNANVYCAPAKT